MKILVTGVAGFIGMNTTKELLLENHEVVGIDNINNYYDQNLKLDRIRNISADSHFEFIKGDILDGDLISRVFKENNFDCVIHFAAQAGVRYSSQNPHLYVDSNIKGLLNILEACRLHQIKHFIFASSSSVYGLNNKIPFAENDSTDHPVSLYGALKRSGELMSYSYSQSYKLPITCLRFFTVYGPWGRPDQALALFMKAAFSGMPIKIFNNGEMLRDFTYIEDVVKTLLRVLEKPPQVNSDNQSEHHTPFESKAPFNIFNVGGGQPIPLMDFIKIIEAELGFELEKEYLPTQDGDMVMTCADATALEKWLSFKPTTPVSSGIQKYIGWYKDYYQI